MDAGAVVVRMDRSVMAWLCTTRAATTRLCGVERGIRSEREALDSGFDSPRGPSQFIGERGREQALTHAA